MDNVQHISQFFESAHLSERLQAISMPFCDVARQLREMTPEQDRHEVELLRGNQASSILNTLQRTIDVMTPGNPEATWAVVKISEACELMIERKPLDLVLRKLLEAKDCAVRSLLAK